MSRHLPVMLQEVLEMLADRTIHYMLDGTCGAGGHAKAILEAHHEIIQYVACDQDPSALKIAREQLKMHEDKVVFCRSNFSLPPSIPPKFDAILLDIGVSSMQLDTSERGFSFMRDGPLDMRMDPDAEVTAADIVNQYDRISLETIFREFGEERYARKIADALVEKRRKHPFTTTGELASVVVDVVPRSGKLHPATRVFQALRIAVNAELDVLRRAIPLLASRLSPQGCFCILTFHSLEDRIVKEEFKKLSLGADYLLVSKKPIQPTRVETGRNPRSRSAKLRGLERV